MLIFIFLLYYLFINVPIVCSDRKIIIFKLQCRILPAILINNCDANVLIVQISTKNLRDVDISIGLVSRIYNFFNSSRLGPSEKIILNNISV